MRGRGFGRGMSGNRHDPFRSRPPNTSRPPSMHVDDFIKMENQQGPSIPGNNNMGRRGPDKVFMTLYHPHKLCRYIATSVGVSSYKLLPTYMVQFAFRDIFLNIENILIDKI